jgi:hypothetical protein
VSDQVDALFEQLSGHLSRDQDGMKDNRHVETRGTEAHPGRVGKSTGRDMGEALSRLYWSIWLFRVQNP